MLALLPDLTFPITAKSIDRLMDSVVQLNLIDASLTERQQRGLTLYFHTHDLWIKSKGKIDYRGAKGHALLMEHGMNFVGGSAVTTRHGDLAAAHLAIDYHDAQTRRRDALQPPIHCDVNNLLKASRDLCDYPPEMQKKVGLLMDYLGKRPI